MRSREVIRQVKEALDVFDSVEAERIAFAYVLDEAGHADLNTVKRLVALLREHHDAVTELVDRERVLARFREAETDEGAIDGMGLAAHQLAFVLGIEESTALAACETLENDGLLSRHLTAGGTLYWRYTGADR